MREGRVWYPRLPAALQTLNAAKVGVEGSNLVARSSTLVDATLCFDGRLYLRSDVTAPR